MAVLVDADLLEQRLLLGHDDFRAYLAELVLRGGQPGPRLEHLLLDAGELRAVLLDLLSELDRLGALQVLDPLLEIGVLSLKLFDAPLAAECHDGRPSPVWRCETTSEARLHLPADGTAMVARRPVVAGGVYWPLATHAI